MPDGTTDVVHPEVRAHINSLVSAVCATLWLQLWLLES